MLAALSIQNVVLIDQLSIEFQKGLCALTGETGAGKSILLDSLGLALGARSESGLVRKGADSAQVTAEFHIPKNHASIKILKNAGLEGDTTLILRRSVGADGRSRAFINVTLLREIGDTLVEIHGQFDTHGLLNPATHRALLDDYAGIGNAIENVWGAWKTAMDELAALKIQTEKSRTEEKFLRQAVEDLDGLDPKAGEEDRLAGLRERLMHREQVLDGLNAAYQALNGEEDPVRKAWGIIDRISGKLGEPAEALNAMLARATAEIQDAVAQIESVSADLQETEESLETIDDRLFALRAQARKHQCTVEDLPDIRNKLAAQLNLIEHGEEVLAAKMKDVEKTRKAFEIEARKASEQRKKIAEKLDKLVQKELPPLKLDKARFVTKIEQLEEAEWGPHGMDRVRFLVATNPGAEPGPLNKIASGGEMARFMLALKVVMAEVGTAQSLVFDEVDTGIGGSTADAVGERLARLGEKAQVLVVTHAPQVAARAGHHYIVQKSGAKEVKTNILHIDGAKRREEIARMLAGATITEEARKAADKLLETGT